MISSSRVNDPMIDGPLAVCLFAFAFDYTPWTITNSESAVAWRSAFGSAYSGETHHCCARSMLGNSAMMTLSSGYSPSRTMGPPRATNQAPYFAIVGSSIRL
jgi:hypothetical protein